MVPASSALLPGVSTPIWGAAMTLSVRGCGVQALWERMASMIYQGQPPCDPHTLEVHLDQRRAIDAWIRSREVKCALPQRASVLSRIGLANHCFLRKLKLRQSFRATFKFNRPGLTSLFD